MVAHANILQSKCAQFRNESQFIDVRLKVGEDIFPAHRIVLAANSDYFYAMFTDGMKESNQEVIELKDESISPDVFKIILNSIYTGDLGHCLYRYDPETNVWERLPHSCGEIKHLCVTAEHLYAFPANCKQHSQKYNFAQRKWEHFRRVEITFNAKSLFFYSGIAVLNNKVYVLYVEKSQTIMNQAVLHCFDPPKDQWEKKANTSQFHFGSSLLVVNGKLYVAGGNVSCDHAHRPYGNPAPVEMYNEETNAWTVVEHKNVLAFSSLDAVEIEGRVYFIINQFPYDSGIRLTHGELNHTVLQEWENLAKIDQGAVLSYLAVKRF